MKILIHLFSFYIIMLSCMPCADAEPISSVQKTTINKESESQHHDDICSPLCVCNCCGCHGFAVSLIAAANFFIVKKSIAKKLPQYKSLPASNFFVSIWQPPQIA